MSLSIIRNAAIRILPEAALLPLRKIHYARVLRGSTGSEEPELAVLSQLVSAGDYVLDIGANFGRYTYHLSRLTGATGKVFSMEPISSTFKILSSNVAKLSLRNVLCLNQAASSTTGFVKMEVPEYQTGGKNFYEAHIVSTGTRLVPCIKLDDAYLDLPRLSFIKCDVEGHELDVLTGARKLIDRFHPKWLIEIGGDPDRSESKANRAFSLLRRFGYEAYVADHGQLRLRCKDERATNYFFLY